MSSTAPVALRHDLVVRKIGFADLRDAIAKGVDDFLAMPTHVILLSVIYPVVGLLLARMSFRLRHDADLIPSRGRLCAASVHFAAIGLYELSRRREEGLDTSWKHAFEVARSSSADAIFALALMLVILFVAWLAVAQALYQSLFGYGAPRIHRTVSSIKSSHTREGWTLIIAGNAIGFLFAVTAFAISVVSFPLLLDHDVGTVVAVHTSIKAVLLNPVIMAAWALFIAAGAGDWCPAILCRPRGRHADPGAWRKLASVSQSCGAG